MRTFAPGPNGQQPASPRPGPEGRARFRQNRDVESSLHLRRPIENRFSHRLLDSNAGNVEVESLAAESATAGHDFSRLAVFPKMPVTAQSKLGISNPGDSYEREADRVADEVMTQPACAALSGAPRLVQRSSGQSDDQMDAAPAGVDQAIASPGTPLEPRLREDMEGRFGHNLSHVRLHSGSVAEQSAYDMNALAYTVGPHIVFGAGRFAPETQEGRRLIAHELAHVVQQKASSAGAATIARQTFGTAKTAAPPAKNVSPGDIFRGKLRDEVALFANAGIILAWIVSQRTLAGGATVTSITTSSLFADTATMKKLKPQPASVDDLLPALQMLQFYDVVKPKAPGDWEIVLAPAQPGQAQQDVNRGKFDQNRKDISTFQKSFETRFDAAGHPIKQIAQQQLLEDSLAAGAASEFKEQKTAETNLAAVTAELDEFVAFRKKGKPVFRVTTDSPGKATAKGKTFVMLPIAGQKAATPVDEGDFDHIEAIRTGTSPEAVARRTAIETRVKAAEKGLFAAQAFHRFATEMVWFLHELDKTSSIKFTAGTYPRHGKFGEYAADMYPRIDENTEGFYRSDKAEQFVDDINTVAEAGHPIWGKFAWQIVYNDATLQATINTKYGARMSSAPHHGPAPDKLHMHLDIRPLDVKADPDTGYRVEPSGRVVLY